MKEEILTESEKETFEKYINFMLQNGFKKEEFEFTKIPNPNPYVLRVKAESFIKNMKVENCALEGMDLGKTYTWKELGLYDVNKDILSDKEKEYLSAVIKPFKDKVKCITKEKCGDKCKDCIQIVLDNNERALLPCFNSGAMYKGMEEDKMYTPNELGI